MGFPRTLKSIFPAEIAINNAKTGPVSQKRVDVGTEMPSFERHAGIGSSSRKV